MMYRIVLLNNDQIEVQAFADLTNDTYEDWKEIKLSLVANELQIITKKDKISNYNQNQNLMQNQMQQMQQVQRSQPNFNQQQIRRNNRQNLFGRNQNVCVENVCIEDEDE